MLSTAATPYPSITPFRTTRNVESIREAVEKELRRRRPKKTIRFNQSGRWMIAPARPLHSPSVPRQGSGWCGLLFARVGSANVTDAAAKPRVQKLQFPPRAFELVGMRVRQGAARQPHMTATLSAPSSLISKGLQVSRSAASTATRAIAATTSKPVQGLDQRPSPACPRDAPARRHRTRHRPRAAKFSSRPTSRP
jgi:hypothetical protein